MRKAKEISETMLQLLTEAEQERKRMIERESEVDRMISAIYHELELVRLNAIQAYKVTVKLQELLRERRKIKYERSTLTVLCDAIKTHNLIPAVKKVDSKMTEHISKQSDSIEERGVIRSILGAKKVAMI